MVDNVAVTPGSGATFATDDIGGIQYPRVKIAQGADGTGVDVSSAAPLNVTLANGSVPSHAVTNAGTFATQVTTVNGVAPAFGSGARGATVQRVTIATDDSVPVTIASVPSHAVTNAGTFAVQNTAATPAGTNLMGKVDVQFAGTVPDTGSGTGGSKTQRVIVDSSQLSSLGQTTMALSAPVVQPSDTNGPYSSTANFVSGAITTAMTGTTSTSLVAAPGASLRNYITTIIVSNSHATVGTDVVIQDGSGGTTLMTIPAAAVYGGAVINLPVPLKQPTTNTALFCANVTTGASTKVSAVGYKGA